MAHSLLNGCGSRHRQGSAKGNQFLLSADRSSCSSLFRCPNLAGMLAGLAGTNEAIIFRAPLRNASGSFPVVLSVLLIGRDSETHT